MKRLKLEVYLNHFVVHVYDRKLWDIVTSLSKSLVSYKFEFNRRFKRMTRVPDKMYCIVHEAKGTVRYPISLLKQMLSTLGYHYAVKLDNIEIVDYSKIETGLPAKYEFNYKKYELRDYQEQYVAELTRNKHDVRMVDLLMGYGKVQSNGTKIRVPDGWKNVEDLKVGDKVLAPDGTYTNVLGVYPQGVIEIYKLVFSDNRTFEAGADHLWEVLTWGHNTSEGTFLLTKIMTTEEIRLYLENKRKCKETISRLFIRLPEPEQNKDKQYFIHPYIMGIILGDGGISAGNIKITCSSAEVMKRAESFLQPGYKFRPFFPPNKQVVEYSLVLDRESKIFDTIPKVNQYIQELKRLNLLGCTALTKFIPEEYMNGSEEQRWELVKGIMDTDGWVDVSPGRKGTKIKENGEQVSGTPNYSSSSKQLALDFQLLIRSLGGLCRMREKHPFYTYKGQRLPGNTAYAMSVRVKEPRKLFTREHKRLERLNEENQYSKHLKLRIDSIEYVGKKEGTCISVDHPSELYVAENYVVTHNTVIAANAIAKIGKKLAIIILPKYIEKWLEDIENILPNARERTYIAQGSEGLIRLMENTEKAKKDYDIFVFPMRTLSNYINVYADDQTERYENSPYPISPDKLMQAIGVGTLLSDECHQEFYALYRALMYFKVDKFIALSATLEHNDKHMQYIYDSLIPPGVRVSKLVEYEPYIKTYAVKYEVANVQKIPCIRSQGYSHIMFEQYTMANTYFLRQYVDMIMHYVEEGYVARRKKGDKLLIFISTVDMCKHVKEVLNKKYKKLDVRTYIQEDEYENIIDADIIVSTLVSSSTAITIPNLITTIMTIPVGSSQANNQSFGRLRRLKGKETRFYYLYASNFDKHRDLSRKREEAIKDKSLSYTYLRYTPSPTQPELLLK